MTTTAARTATFAASSARAITNPLAVQNLMRSMSAMALVSNEIGRATNAEEMAWAMERTGAHSVKAAEALSELAPGYEIEAVAALVLLGTGRMIGGESVEEVVTYMLAIL